MGRRGKYGFEKRQRELKKQKKKEAKAERRRLKREGLTEDAVDEEVGDGTRASNSDPMES